MTDVRVTILPILQNVDLPAGTTVRDCLAKVGIALDMPCGGKGTCGKCLIELNGQKVRACQATITENSVIQLPQSLGTIAVEGVDICTESNLPVFSAGSSKPVCGVAVDIGTTTVAVSLVDTASGKSVASAGQLNRQTAFGADVISRIHFEQTQSDGLNKLNKCIVEQIQEIIRLLCQSIQLDSRSIKNVAVTGNTAMLTWFLGQSGLSLGEIPFSPIIKRDGAIISAQSTGLDLPNSRVIIPPIIGGFLGADIVGGIAQSIQIQQENPCAKWLTIDIGTNGEIALNNGGQLSATSTAAGPALEGAGISIGQRALPGAIDSVSINDAGNLNWSTIGKIPPTGICGSGIVDLIACLRHSNAILPNGKLIHPPESPLNITASDVRQVQLVCGAIRSGIIALLENQSLSISQLDSIYIAGGFGSHLKKENLINIGLLPTESDFTSSEKSAVESPLVEKIHFLGNSALIQAQRLAAANDSETEAILESQQYLARSVTAINLAELPHFAELFTRSMKFPVLK